MGCVSFTVARSRRQEYGGAAKGPRLNMRRRHGIGSSEAQSLGNIQWWCAASGRGG